MGGRAPKVCGNLPRPDTYALEKLRLKGFRISLGKPANKQLQHECYTAEFSEKNGGQENPTFEAYYITISARALFV